MTLLAYDYPLLGIFWTMLWFFLWFAWIVILVRVFADIFRSHDMGGFAKALWSIFVILVPFLGVFIYLIVRGHHMAEQDMADAQKRDQQFQSYVKDVAGSGSTSTADELAKLADLKDRGVISDAEFQQQKAKILV